MGFFDNRLDRFLARHIAHGQLELSFPDGTRGVYGQARAKPVRASIRSHKWLRKILLDPELKVGEAYMAGALNVQDQSIYDLLDLLWKNVLALTGPPGGPGSLVRQLLKASRNVNSPTRARRNAAHHYDIGDELYRLFLDSDLQYSCAYYRRADDSLETAQAAKKAHIARKLCIEPGDRVLDIGCGWGGLALYLADEHAARVLGVTLAERQLETAETRAERAGLERDAAFKLADYRSLEATFDRIVSVGMLEHVGRTSIDAYFAQVARLLDANGLALIHSIGRTGGPGETNPWIERYIFPGGYIPALSELMPAIERAGLCVLDVEVLRLHYAETLRAWRQRFLANAEAAERLHDAGFVRMWDFYLSASELSFRHGAHVVFQLQLAKRQDAAPLTRDYLYGPTPVERPRRRPAAAEESHHAPH